VIEVTFTSSFNCALVAKFMIGKLGNTLHLEFPYQSTPHQPIMDS